DNLTKYKLAQAQYISRNSTGMPVNSVDKQGEMHRMIGQRRSGDQEESGDWAIGSSGEVKPERSAIGCRLGQETFCSSKTKTAAGKRFRKTTACSYFARSTDHPITRLQISSHPEVTPKPPVTVK
ncbi:MAG TPA: hypothetical protein VJ453_14765, partial [Terriglobales bacterium]|nr:hypothetical protein [Terriglobales bacterium]